MSIRETISIVDGRVPGFSHVNKFGINEDIDTGSTPETVWGGGGLYTGFPAFDDAAETVEIFSDDANDTAAGTGARTVQLEGLSADWVYQTETLTMDGVTGAPSTNTWRRVSRLMVKTAGSGGKNAGVLTCPHTTTTANVFAKMLAGVNRTTVAAYTTPADVTGYLEYIRVSIIRASGAAGSAFVTLRGRDARSDAAFDTLRAWKITTQDSVDRRFKYPIVLPQKCDIKVDIETVSDNNTEATAEIDILLVDH